MIRTVCRTMTPQELGHCHEHIWSGCAGALPFRAMKRCAWMTRIDPWQSWKSMRRQEEAWSWTPGPQAAAEMGGCWHSCQRKAAWISWLLWNFTRRCSLIRQNWCTGNGTYREGEWYCESDPLVWAAKDCIFSSTDLSSGSHASWCCLSQRDSGIRLLFLLWQRAPPERCIRTDGAGLYFEGLYS